MIRFTLASIFIASVATLPTLAAETADGEDDSKVSYWKDVRPIFQANCQGCHQPAKQGGDYEMTDFARLLNGGESDEPAVVAGKPEESYLLSQIQPSDGVAEMPKNKDPLTEAEIATVSKWIAEGANDDTPASAKQRFDADHPPVYSAAPVITAISFSPDGKLLAVSGYHEVLLHDATKIAEGASPIGRLVGMSERIESIAFSPDGKQLATAGGSPGRLGEVQIWDVQQQQLGNSIAVTHDTCYGASWSSDGKLVAFGCPDNTVRAIDAESGKQVLYNGAHNDWVFDTVFSLDNKHLISVSRDRSMKLIDVSEERFIDNITSITPGALKGGLHAVDRHPTKDELLIGGADGVPKIYRMFREKDRKIGDDYNLIRNLAAMPGRVFDVSYSKDGNLVVAGSSINGKGHTHLFNANDGKLQTEMKGDSAAIYAVAISPDAKTVVSGGFSGKLRIHNAETGELTTEFIPVDIEANKAVAKK